MSRLRVLAACLLCVLTACSQPAAPANTVLTKEQAALAPLKTKYKDVVTGLEVRDRTLVMYVEPNAMQSMDEDAEAAMKTDALNRWKLAWTRAHPHQHGKLRLDLRDYFGRELSSRETSV